MTNKMIKISSKTEKQKIFAGTRHDDPKATKSKKLFRRKASSQNDLSGLDDNDEVVLTSGNGTRSSSTLRYSHSQTDLVGHDSVNNNNAMMMIIPPSPTVTPKPLKSCLSNSYLPMLIGDDNNNDGSFRGSTSSKTNNGITRSVSFSNIEIREHPLTLGDHPAVGSGPALSLDWYVEENNTNVGNDDEEVALKCRTILLSVDEYEDTRIPRKPKPVIFGKNKRERLLQNFGVSLDDIKEAERECAAERYRANFHKDDQISILTVVGKVSKLMKSRSSSAATQLELDQLMRRAAIAERIQKDQMDRYYEEQRKQLLEDQMNQIRKEQLEQQQQQHLMVTTSTSLDSMTIDEKRSSIKASSIIKNSWIDSMQCVPKDEDPFEI